MCYTILALYIVNLGWIFFNLVALFGQGKAASFRNLWTSEAQVDFIKYPGSLKEIQPVCIALNTDVWIGSASRIITAES